MLMDATGEPVKAVGDSFVVHMDREALNDYPMGLYDVTVTIKTFVPDREIAWTILGQIRPQIGHVYGYTARAGGRWDARDLLLRLVVDRSGVEGGRDLPGHLRRALRATLGILARTVARRRTRSACGNRRINRGYAPGSVPAGTERPRSGRDGIHQSRRPGIVRGLPALAGPALAAGDLAGLVQLPGRSRTSASEHGLLGGPRPPLAPLFGSSPAPRRHSPFQTALARSRMGVPRRHRRGLGRSGWRRVLATLRSSRVRLHAAGHRVGLVGALREPRARIPSGDLRLLDPLCPHDGSLQTPRVWSAQPQRSPRERRGHLDRRSHRDRGHLQWPSWHGRTDDPRWTGAATEVRAASPPSRSLCMARG